MAGQNRHSTTGAPPRIVPLFFLARIFLGTLKGAFEPLRTSLASFSVCKSSMSFFCCSLMVHSRMFSGAGKKRHNRVKTESHEFGLGRA